MNRNELNSLITANQLPLNPFNERGYSINQMPAACAFIYCNENDDLLFYISACPLKPYHRSQADLLVSLLQLSGPATRYPDLHLGLDYHSDYLWISSALTHDLVNEETLEQKLQSFTKEALLLREDVLNLMAQGTEAYQKATTESAPQQSPVQEVAADDASSELMSLMASSQVLWG